jgi:hypothetical protein
MAFSQATLVNRVRRRLGDDPFLDTCTEAMDATETDLSVADTTKYSVGSVVEFLDDGEQCLITALFSATVLTVQRNHNLSVTATAGTGTTHAINTLIATDPPHKFQNVAEAIDEVIQSLWPHVYTSVEATITPSASNPYYSVAATFEDLSSAMQRDTSTVSRPRYYGGRRNPFSIELLEQLPDNFPDTEDTGKALYIPHLYNATKTIHVVGIRRLTDTLTGGNYDDLTDGLEVDCVMNFAVEELLEISDAQRTAGEDVSMNDQSVVPGRRSAVADSIWRRKALRQRHQWQEDLRRNLPHMATYRGR